MKKIAALVLSLLFVSFSTVAVFAGSEESDTSSNTLPVIDESTPETIEKNPEEQIVIDGYTIPEEPDIVWKNENWASNVNEYGDTIDLLSATDDTSGIIVSQVYRNNILIQKCLYDVPSALMYTEVYEGNTDKEVIIEEKEDYIRIVVEKPVSEETLDQVFHPIHKAPQQTSYYEPLFDSDLPAASYGDGYRLVYSGGGESYAPTIYGDVTRKMSKAMIGETKYWKFNFGQSLAEVASIISATVSGGFPGFVSELVAFTVGGIVAYNQAPSYTTYRHTYDYRVRLKQAGNNIYSTHQRVFDYWYFYNSANGKRVYEEKEFLGPFILDNHEMLKVGISNYLEYHFYDIVNHWGKDHIKWAYEKGYLTGIGPYTFSPNGTTTRGMAITVLHRMAGSPNAGTNTSFTDVSSSSYYARAVSWGVKNGIVSGTSSTTFSPESNVTREQFAVMLYNFAKYQGKNVKVTSNLNSYNDGSTVSSWAKTAMQWAVGKKIFTGDGGYLKPKQNATRAELSKLIHTYSDRA